ncbi:MAG: type III pantothenate kinase [Clostridia bacterium]|nr:type III pantothenate kinase [Clostridia bacterium]
MIYAVDIGNTNICVAGFEKEYEPVFIKNYPDNLYHFSGELVKALRELPTEPEGAVLCSVVPALAPLAKTALDEITGGNVVVIDSGFNDGLRLSGYDRHKLGNDRVADMTAVKSLYPVPAVIFDMGTATTVSVIDREGVFVGGMILPGLGLSVNALSSGTALLPGIKPYQPNSLLGQDTVSCINNGVIYSQASSIEGICARVEDEFGEKITAVVTGGAAKFILPVCKRQVIYDEHLLLKGLKILYDNRK